jgi:hypothetical protein
MKKKMFQPIQSDAKTHIVYDAEDIEPTQEDRYKYAPKTPCRLLIYGPSGSGKTNLLMNLIFQFLPWTRLYIYAKDLSEPKYVLLRDALEESAAADDATEDWFHFGQDDEDIPYVDDLDDSEMNLIVFDDFVNDPKSHNKIADLFIRGRKKNTSIIYLTQSYFKVPKTIRLQCNYFAFFGTNDRREKGELFLNHATSDIRDKTHFLKLFSDATCEKYSFLFLDPNNLEKTYRIRKRFEQLFLS